MDEGPGEWKLMERGLFERYGDKLSLRKLTLPMVSEALRFFNIVLEGLRVFILLLQVQIYKLGRLMGKVMIAHMEFLFPGTFKFFFLLFTSYCLLLSG